MKQFSIIVTLLTVAMASALQAFASATDSLAAPLTLNDCLLYARQHAHANRLSRLNEKTAAADRRIAASDLMPYISFGANGNLSFGRNIDPETNTYVNKRTLATGLGIDFSLPLFDGLVRMNNFKALKAAEQRARKSRRAEEDKVSLDVIRNFYNVAYCRAMTEQMQRQLQRDSTDLLTVIRNEALGTRSGADVAEVEAIVAADIYELTNQTNLLKKAYLALRSSMGMTPTDEPLSLLFTPIAPCEDGLAVKLAEVEEAELGVSQSRYLLRAARGGWWPRITLNSGISTAYYRLPGITSESFRSQWHNNMGEYIGLSLSFPLFDGLATAGRVRKAALNLKENEVRLEQTCYQIEKATSEARLDLEAAREELSAATYRLKAEQEAYRAIHRKFELGLASASDLYAAGAKLATAEATRTGKEIQLTIASITLNYYNGLPLIN